MSRRGGGGGRVTGAERDRNHDCLANGEDRHKKEGNPKKDMGPTTGHGPNGECPRGGEGGGVGKGKKKNLYS